MYKFMWNGIKDTETKELVKCWYSKGNILKNGVLDNETITIYGEHYKRLPLIDGLEVLNDSDIMTDYFENDRIYVDVNNEHYEEVKKANIEQEIHNAKRNIKCYEKSVERCIRNAEIYKEVPAGAYYLKHLEIYQNGLRLQKEYIENLQRCSI